MCGLHIVRSDLYHDGKPFFRTQRKPRFPRGREGTVLNERPHVDYFDGLRIFAALCVIFMHTAAGPLRAGINTGWQAEILQTIDSFWSRVCDIDQAFVNTHFESFTTCLVDVRAF